MKEEEILNQLNEEYFKEDLTEETCAESEEVKEKGFKAFFKGKKKMSDTLCGVLLALGIILFCFTLAYPKMAIACALVFLILCLFG